MPFEKGHQKYGGRVKGTPNKRDAALIDKAEQMGVNPFEILLLFAKGDHKALDYELPIPIDLRLNAAKEACAYIWPKKKSINVSANIADLPVRQFPFPNPKEGQNEESSTVVTSLVQPGTDTHNDR